MAPMEKIYFLIFYIINAYIDIIPVPEHKSRRVDVFDGFINLNNSLYKTSAANVLI